MTIEVCGAGEGDTATGFSEYLGQNFLLVDLREFFSDLGSGGMKKKKNKKALKMTS